MYVSFRNTVFISYCLPYRFRPISANGFPEIPDPWGALFYRKTVGRRVLDGKRYYYKGLKQGVAIEKSLALYVYILEGFLGPRSVGASGTSSSDTLSSIREIQDERPFSSLPVDRIIADI
jgi:hypothetical protein